MDTASATIHADLTDDEVIALARSARLPVGEPYRAEILRSYRALSQIAGRLPDGFVWTDEPGFRFDPTDALSERS